MIKRIIYIVSTLAALLLFSACDSDWDGEITVTGGTKLPNWINWIIKTNSPSFDGVDIIEVKTPDTAEYIFRIKTYSSLVDILTVQCNCNETCNHKNINFDENEFEKLLGKFNQEFFETKNLIVIEIGGSVITMNFHINNINKNGVIHITETEKLTFLPIVNLRVPVTIAIEIDSSFITPTSMGVSIK